MLIRNQILYFINETIIDQFTIYVENASFDPFIYKTINTSLKYCCARKEFTNLFEDVLRNIVFLMIRKKSD